MLIQSYSFPLKYEILSGLVTSGQLLESISASVLVCFTSIGKVLLYQPTSSSPSFLNINREVKAIGILDVDGEGSKLAMASENTLIIHDVENNSDMFYKDIPDGISVLKQGKLEGEDLIFVGGNCSIQGFNKKGEEVYWNVVSDDVTAIDTFGDDSEYIAVASADNYIRCFKNEEIIYQFTTKTIPISLCGLMGGDLITIIYGMENGSISLAEQQITKWVTEDEQNQPNILILFNDLYFIVGRFIGIVELRQIKNGSIIQQVNLEVVLSGMIYDDLRGTKQKQLVCITKGGDVKGFTIVEKEENLRQLSDEVQQLQQLKNELIQQQQLYESNTDYVNTKIQVGYIKDHAKQCINLVLISHDQNIYLTQTVLISDTLFKDGYLHNSTEKSYKIHIPLKMLNSNIKDKIKALTLASSSPYTTQFQVIETTFTLPKFANFCFTEEQLKIESYLEAQIKERIPRFVKWIDQCFIIEDKIRKRLENLTNEFTFNAINIITNLPLSITFNSLQGYVTIRCDSIQVCGEIIQDLCDFIQITELKSEGQFPKEMDQFKQILDTVEQHQNIKLQISGDVAEAMNNVKCLTVKAEDSRMIGDIKTMQRTYANIMVQNKLIQSELLKKQQNTEILMKNLKEVSVMISKASELRVGQAKNLIIQLCRNAIKKKNFYTLVEVIQKGREN